MIHQLQKTENKKSRISTTRKGDPQQQLRTEIKDKNDFLFLEACG
jgi:hypothetical protein